MNPLEAPNDLSLRQEATLLFDISFGLPRALIRLDGSTVRIPLSTTQVAYLLMNILVADRSEMDLELYYDTTIKHSNSPIWIWERLEEAMFAYRVEGNIEAAKIAAITSAVLTKYKKTNLEKLQSYLDVLVKESRRQPEPKKDDIVLNLLKVLMEKM